MKISPRLGRTAAVVTLLLAGVFLAIVALRWSPAQSPHQGSEPAGGSAPGPAHAEPAVDLASSQLDAIKIEPVGTFLFPVEAEAVGAIAYDEDCWVQVFPPYQGKIITTCASLGDDVKKGQALYTIDSPDLIQAESALIGAAATFALTSKELARVRELVGTNGISEREVEQAVSEQQAAEGTLKATRDAVRFFGKTEAEIEQITSARKLDPALVVFSPVSGRVTARNAQPGLLVQPGIAPAPYSVADLSTKWMVANVMESDSPQLKVGQSVRASVMAFPGRIFEGKISRLAEAVDPNTHRVMIRSEIADPKDELRPGMLATFVIQVRQPVESPAISMNGVVRNGDGSMTAWVTTDRRHFQQRLVTLGLQRNGRYQVLEGLQLGELAVADGAVFLSNMLNAPASD